MRFRVLKAGILGAGIWLTLATLPMAQFSVGGGVSAPIAIYKPEPTYSKEARKAKLEGTVVLWIVVDSSGNVTDVRVVKPLGLGLDENAEEVVRTWKFKPAMRNGVAV